MSQIKSIIRQSIRNDDQLNIITFPVFERTESFLFSNMNHNFYALMHPSWKDWKTEYAPIPSNYHLLNIQKDPRDQLPSWITPDVVFSQNRMAHYPTAKFYANKYNIPIITCEHMSAHPKIQEAFKRQMRSMTGDIDIFVTDLVRESWGFPPEHGRVIHNAVDPELFKRDEEIEKQGYILTVANDFVGRDIYCGYNVWDATVGHLYEKKLPVRLVGDNRGLSEPARNTGELVKFYNEASLLLSTTLVSSLPTTIIEAMSCGLPIVSTGTTIIPTLLVKHGHNGFISETNNPRELAEYCKVLTDDPKMCEEMGQNARRWVEENFSCVEFLSQYKEVFREVAEMRK